MLLDRKCGRNDIYFKFWVDSDWLTSVRWITNAQAANRMVLLARTTPLEEVKKASGGLSLFYCDIGQGKKEGTVTAQPIHKMGGRSVDANQVDFHLFPS